MVVFHFNIERTSCSGTATPVRVSWPARADSTQVNIESCTHIVGQFNRKNSEAVEQRRLHQPVPPALDSASHALGLGTLFGNRNGGDTAELRFWFEGSITIPDHMMRLVKVGNTVTGGVAAYWHKFHAAFRGADSGQGGVVRKYLGSSCGPIVDFGNTEACWQLLADHPDWKRLWDSVVSLGALTLRDQVLVPHDWKMINDGGGVVVEVRRGNKYRWYDYENARSYPDADDRRMVAIEKALRVVWSWVKPR